jgi:hypothetical protein
VCDRSANRLFVALALASTTQVGFQAAVLLIWLLILILGAPLNHDGRK